jgi:DNA-binding transcriptional ArsR family regulator
VPENVPPKGWAGLPRNEIKDAQTARALAHPVRIKIIEQLAFRGAMTATELSELIDESPANTSWHLRQLARYGFIEEAGGGTGRQRPWQMIVQSNTFGDPGADRETAAAVQATIDLWLTREVDALKAWQRREADEPEWSQAAYLSMGMGFYTLEELRTLGEQIGELLAPYFSRLTDPSSRPPGARPVRTVQWGVPADSFEDLTQTPAID